MNKISRKILTCLTVLSLIISGMPPVFAEESDVPPKDALHITSEQEFLEFAENCRLDSYSKNLSVSLDADLSLKEYTFSGIPVFCGKFYGNGHSVTGLEITASGSNIGFFRYLTQSAHVRDLCVEGAVAPDGSRSTVGGIVGCNAGTVENCRFRGLVTGAERIGAISGKNELTGTITKCSASGNVHGDHFAGGIVGENLGVVRTCTGESNVNVTVRRNGIEISDINLDSLLGTEAATTVTDIGGIAGISSGVIRGCTNNGNVGYPHMGYNIGGIAGTQQGYITECQNYGKVLGRKDVGGIAGQMEPAIAIAYSEDTLQILRRQMEVLNDLARQAEKNLHTNTDQVKNLLVSLQDQLGIASDAIEDLIPPEGSHRLPDFDQITASLNTLSSCLRTAHTVTGQIIDAVQDTGSSLSNDLQAMIDQMDIINKTLGGASDNLGGKAEDVSDADTPENTTGKISSCQNIGPVNGDSNSGGIVGSIVWENDLDPEKDLEVLGSSSLNVSCQARAVVLDCENYAPVFCKKRNAGGIAGWVSLGLIKHSTNTGNIAGDLADCVGGVAGYSTGFIRSCSAKCELQGSSYIGGIAGSGTVATDCRSCVHITDGKEFLGAVLGMQGEDFVRDDNPLSGNFYLTAQKDLGAIDGISYDGLAQPLDPEKFFALPDLPGFFKTSTLTFLVGDSILTRVLVPFGEGLSAEDIPSVPGKENQVGSWDGLEKVNLDHIYFSQALFAQYTPCRQTVESELLTDKGRPVLLAQGSFANADHFRMEQTPEFPQLSDENTPVISWVIPVFSQEHGTQLRYSCPQGCTPETLRIFLKTQDGSWREAETAVSGNYLVFTAEAGENQFCVFSVPHRSELWILVASVIFLVILMAAAFLLICRHRKKAKALKTAKEAENIPDDSPKKP